MSLFGKCDLVCWEVMSRKQMTERLCVYRAPAAAGPSAAAWGGGRRAAVGQGAGRSNYSYHPPLIHATSIVLQFTSNCVMVQALAVRYAYDKEGGGDDEGDAQLVLVRRVAAQKTGQKTLTQNEPNCREFSRIWGNSRQFWLKNWRVLSSPRPRHRRPRRRRQRCTDVCHGRRQMAAAGAGVRPLPAVPLAGGGQKILAQNQANCHEFPRIAANSRQFWAEKLALFDQGTGQAPRR